LQLSVTCSAAAHLPDPQSRKENSYGAAGRTYNSKAAVALRSMSLIVAGSAGKSDSPVDPLPAATAFAASWKYFDNKFHRSAKIFFLGLLLLCGAVATAQQETSIEPGQRSTITSWVAQNRYLELFAGQHQQDYREIDTLARTGNGILDSENGAQSDVGLALRWQSTAGWLFHLQAQRQSGATDYNGYLQAGNGSLTPYRARTGNTATQFSLNFGYALNVNTWAVMPANWQITPMLQFGKHHWERNLVQYRETYDYNTQALGGLVQWQVRAGTVLDAQILAGRAQPASVSVPVLGFIARQPAGQLREWQLGIVQDLSSITTISMLKGWHVTARYASGRYEHGPSIVVNGLQAPPNQQRSRTWTLGLQKQF
jgi:hypothetical protein